MWDDRYRIDDVDSLFSPSLVVFHEVLSANLVRMIEMAGGPQRLRPHCKTHKMAPIIQLQLEAGIERHKCATIAEAEMLAATGVEDIFLAYNLVGPNIDRMVRLCEEYPDVRFSVTADHPGPLGDLSAAMSDAGQTVDVLLDVNTGMNRTGMEPDANAERLYAQIAELPGVEPGGLHVYDGHNRHRDVNERAAAVDAVWQRSVALRDKLTAAGLSVPRMVAGGTGSFPCLAKYDDPTLELSPGTIVFYDAGYQDAFPDLPFEPAALLLTRAISKPYAGAVTWDLGHKACAADPPAGARLRFPDIPDAREVQQNEEHLVMETSQADQIEPGDWTLAVPVHACPTSAVHQRAYVIQEGDLIDTWRVTARDRVLTI